MARTNTNSGGGTTLTLTTTGTSGAATLTGSTLNIPVYSGGGGSPSIGGTLTGATAGSVLFAGSGTFAQDNNNFFYDVTTHNLGLGTVVPGFKLTVFQSDSGITTNGSALEKILQNSGWNTTAGTNPFVQYGQIIQNSATRTSGGNALTNVGLYITATNGQNNYALTTGLNAGNVGIQNVAPGELLSLGTTGSVGAVLSMAGSSTGKVIIQPATAAGSWTWTLPTTAGTNNYVLTTNGSGVSTWSNPASLPTSFLLTDGSGTTAATTGLNQQNVNLGGNASGPITINMNQQTYSIVNTGGSRHNSFVFNDASNFSYFTNPAQTMSLGVNVTTPAYNFDLFGSMNVTTLNYGDGLFHIDPTGVVLMGDYNFDQNGTGFTVDDSNQVIHGNATNFNFSTNSYPDYLLHIDDTGVVNVGDSNGDVNGTSLTVNDGAATTTLNSNNVIINSSAMATSVTNSYQIFDNASNLLFSVDPTLFGNITIQKTITPSLTTGNVTINKPAGTVNIASASSSATVTNSLVDINSIIICTVASSDVSLKTVSITQTTGSFTVTGNAVASSGVRVNFLVIN